MLRFKVLIILYFIFKLTVDGFYLNSNPMDNLNVKSSILETINMKSGPMGQCLKFWYNINGIASGTLNVKLLFNNTEFLVFTKSEKMGGNCVC